MITQFVLFLIFLPNGLLSESHGVACRIPQIPDCLDLKLLRLKSLTTRMERDDMFLNLLDVLKLYCNN